MNAEDVTRIIEAEIAGEWELSNLHGVDLKRCLVPPMLRAFDGASSGDHWLVLEEDPIPQVIQDRLPRAEDDLRSRDLRC